MNLMNQIYAHYHQGFFVSSEESCDNFIQKLVYFSKMVNNFFERILECFIYLLIVQSVDVSLDLISRTISLVKCRRYLPDRSRGTLKNKGNEFGERESIGGYFTIIPFRFFVEKPIFKFPYVTSRTNYTNYLNYLKYAKGITKKQRRFT